MAKTIFITGAGSGIGRAAAERFAAEGWRVAAADLNPHALDALRAAIGPRHLYLSLDVSDAGAVQRAMAEAAGGNGGRIDMLLNSAGVGTLADFEATPLETLHATVEV